MWSDGPATFDGTYYQIDEGTEQPTAGTGPASPIAIGGSGPRMLRLVAKYADAWNVEITSRNRGPPIEEKIGHLGGGTSTRPAVPRTTSNTPGWATAWSPTPSSASTNSSNACCRSPAPRPTRTSELTTAEEAREHGDYFIGTPAEVAEQIEAVADLGFERFQLMFIDYPSLEGLRLFADEVMPRV